MLPKKVLHVVEDLRIGGLEKVLASIVLNLDRRKFIPQVWCLAQGGEIADDLIRAGVKLNILRMTSYYNPLKIIKVSNYLRLSKIDIIHTHGYFASTFGRLAAILARNPVIITHIHTTYFGFKKRNILIERFLSYFTDKIVCVSRSTREFTEKIERIDKNKTCLIYNGSKTENGDIVKTLIDRASFALTADDLVIISVGSLVAHKGHQSLLNAIKILSKKHKNLRLMIVGDGPLRSKLEAYAKNLQISSRIVFTGLRKDIFSLLKLSDLFVLPSIEREGLGLALIEAMASGLPLIGTNLGGIPEVIENNVNGILIPPGNSKSLAKAIERLITNQNLRDEMGKQGKRIYKEKFSDKTMIDKIESLYDELSIKYSNK
jgi:glycosyltransferase involved in cell wall biosynthesis